MPFSLFKKVPVQVQNLSGFNCSHSNSFDAKVGTLVPILCDPVIPNTHIDLDVACEVQLPPAATDFYGNIEARMELFFVPYRILWGGWKYFMTNYSALTSPPNANYINVKYLPGLEVTGNTLLGAGSLADMLGYKSTNNASPTGTYRINNALPFLAYQMVYDQWYRDSRITSPIFRPVPNAGYGSSITWQTSPYSYINQDPKVYYTDGVSSLLSLHQRCWDKDYFTNATLQPQAGNSASLKFEAVGENTLNPDDGLLHLDSSFSISALRAANSLQQFEERNNLAGQRYADQIYARFGCYPADAITDRPIYLGSRRFNIYKRNVYQQSMNPEVDSQNPFSGVLANKGTSIGGFGNGRLGKFHATEHGFIFVMFSLVPQAVYSTGIRRYLNYNTLTDFPDPLLQGVGDQPIYQWELKGNYPAALTDDVFGYTQRYAEAKFMSDEVHGKLRDGQNLSAFQLQRTFVGDQSLSTNFLEIPTNYLDQVTSVESSVSNYGCWCQCYFNYRKVQPLAAYSLPTLGEPKDTHTQVINNGGTRL